MCEARQAGSSEEVTGAGGLTATTIACVQVKLALMSLSECKAFSEFEWNWQSNNASCAGATLRGYLGSVFPRPTIHPPNCQSLRLSRRQQTWFHPANLLWRLVSAVRAGEVPSIASSRDGQQWLPLVETITSPASRPPPFAEAALCS